MKSFLLVILSVTLSLIGANFLIKNKVGDQTNTQTTLQRVLETKTIRCGYAVWAPFLVKDPKTGQMSGVLYDIVEEIGKYLRLKIDWAYETGYGNYTEDLNVGRFDMMCATLWADYARVQNSLLLKPELYSGVYAVVRADDNRFVKLNDANNEQYKVTGIDGDITVTLAENLFPKAQIVALPNNADPSLLFENVNSRKADLTFSDLGMFNDYNAKNPNKLKILTNNPAWVFGERMAVKNGEHQLKYMIDTAIEELTNSGKIEDIIRKYEGTSTKPPIKDFMN